MTNEFVFVPESHTPLQQPRVNVLTDFQGETTRVEYSAASPSLTGSYVLCSLNEEPLLCGGRISLTVTGMYTHILKVAVRKTAQYLLKLSTITGMYVYTVVLRKAEQYFYFSYSTISVNLN